MKDNRLLIPSAVEAAIDSSMQELNNSGLKKEIAVFLLGSLVYQTPDENGFRSFAGYAKELEKFQDYLAFFLEEGLLIKDKKGSKYCYSHDVDHLRFLEPYEFDSIKVQNVIRQEFKNSAEHIENLTRFRFSESDLRDFYPPF